jgi:DNA-binding NarL/FixJ family response regulator
MTPIKTFIADIHQLFIEGFERVLDEMDYPKVKVVGTAVTATDLLEGLYEFAPDLLFMELSFTDQDGMELIKKIREEFTDLRICILSGYVDHKFVKEAFQNGADGYYSKFNDQSELVECVNEVMLGNTYLASGLNITPQKNSKRKVSEFQIEDRFLLKKKLTKREQEVLELITKAMNNKEIAEKLYISDQTVGVHRKNIMRKLNVRNTVNLIKFAIDHQLV